MESPLHAVGHEFARVGLAGKVRGDLQYTADLQRPGMLYGKVLRSPHAHARVTAIDVSAAERAPGVHAVLTHLDTGDARINPDLKVLDAEVRFVGDEVAVVAAESAGAAEDALELIQVIYEVLPAVFDIAPALAPGAPAVHPGGNLLDGAPVIAERGDVAAALASAARVVEATFLTQNHGPVGMETRAALAEWEGGRVTVWKSSRGVYVNDQVVLTKALDLPPEQVRVICTGMGGGFGNKDESRLSALAAFIARKAGRPVRMDYGRAEDFLGGANRQATENHLKVGLDADGAPVAFHIQTFMNAGAHVASGRRVTRRVGQAALYLYTCPNARFEGSTIYTNRPAGGSFRGLGAPLGHFAVEVLMDEIAASLGVDPLDYRLRHHVRPEGQPGARTTPPGEPLPEEAVEGGVPFSSNALRECIEAGAERIGWRANRRPNGSATGPRRRGMGMAMGLYKGGGAREAQAVVTVAGDGAVSVAVGIVDVGQGSTTVLAQIAAEALQVRPEQVTLVTGDTEVTPPGHVAAGSSTTVSTGTAVKLAAENARNRLLEQAAAAMGVSDVVLEGGRFRERGGNGRALTLPDVLAQTPGGVTGQATNTVISSDYILNAFGCHFVEAEVEVETGRIRILRYVAAHDSGQIVNPTLAASQVSGGVLQFLGIALREELRVDAASGVTLNPSFLEHKSTSIVDFPAIEVLFQGGPDPVGPYGAKALGEPPVVPVLAAVANAVANATGVWLHEAPFTPERVLRAMAEQGVTP